MEATETHPDETTRPGSTSLAYVNIIRSSSKVEVRRH